jgi:hypothetical protein
MTKKNELPAAELASLRRCIIDMADTYGGKMSDFALAKLLIQALIEGGVTTRKDILGEAHQASGISYNTIGAAITCHLGHRVKVTLWRLNFDGTLYLV